MTEKVYKFKKYFNTFRHRREVSFWRFFMAHKKVERRKELDRRRKRRAERMKLRFKEARSGLTA